MALAISSLSFVSSSISPQARSRNVNSSTLKSNSSFQIVSQMQSSNTGGGRRVWRRRKLTKKDDLRGLLVKRVPFLEEKEWKIREERMNVTIDIYRLMMAEENVYDFVNQVAAEANALVESNMDEYGGEKKAILQVLSERVTDVTGAHRNEAYIEPSFRPGPGFAKIEPH